MDEANNQINDLEHKEIKNKKKKKDSQTMRIVLGVSGTIFTS